MFTINPKKQAKNPALAQSLRYIFLASFVCLITACGSGIDIPDAQTREDLPETIVDPTGVFQGTLTVGAIQYMVRLTVGVGNGQIYNAYFTFVDERQYLAGQCQVHGENMTCSAQGSGASVLLQGALTGFGFNGQLEYTYLNRVFGTFTLAKTNTGFIVPH